MYDVSFMQKFEKLETIIIKCQTDLNLIPIHWSKRTFFRLLIPLIFDPSFPCVAAVAARCCCVDFGWSWARNFCCQLIIRVEKRATIFDTNPPAKKNKKRYITNTTQEISLFFLKITAFNIRAHVWKRKKNFPSLNCNLLFNAHARAAQI